MPRGRRRSSGTVRRYLPSLAAVSLLMLVAATGASADTGSFSNPSVVNIPGSGTGPAPANPYPSTIGAAGMAGTVTRAQVTLSNLDHQFFSDIDALLVGPGGQT